MLTMRQWVLLIFGIVLASLVSCREDFKFSPSNGSLEFSRDTVYLDTVFSNIGSSTYTLKVYNRSKSDIVIPSIRLAQRENSNYRLMVDGMSGKQFENVELLAKDSLFIFIESTINYQDFANQENTFLYTDQIEFDSGSRYQKVELVTLVQDAYFLYPQRNESGQYEGIPVEGSEDQIYGFILDENDPINGNELIWGNDKPYVIYGYAGIPTNKTLRVQAGAKIHFHDNSGIIALNNSSLVVEGTQENPVVFEGDRLEPFYSEIPGQWGAIWLTSGSKNHQISHATIKNSTIGLYVQNCNLSLDNVQIYNSTAFGVMAQSAIINASNTIINQAGQSALACSIGGNYNFVHSTIVNHWNRSHRSQPALIIDNTYLTDQGYIPMQAHFKNSIIWGASNLELAINPATDSQFDYSFDHCLIKFIDINNRYRNNPLYDFTNTNHYMDCIITTNYSSNKADFIAPLTNNLKLGENSIAIGKANWIYAQNTRDITGELRQNPADLGAYNYTPTQD